MSEIMSIHHSKHHNAYVTNLNAALEKYADAGDPCLGLRA
jgi:Fe-Mn family superoxide dismutase